MSWAWRPRWPPGIIEANRTGGTVKRMHCGWAAHAGVAAAGLVAHGVTGPPTVLEGRFGFFQAWLHAEGNAEEVVGGLGESWSVPGIFFKPYPANHFTHAAVDAAAGLREQGIGPDDIERLVLGVPAPNLRTIGEPIEVKRAPETGYMAQFSGTVRRDGRPARRVRLGGLARRLHRRTGQ